MRLSRPCVLRGYRAFPFSVAIRQKKRIPFLKRVRAVLPNKDIWLYSGYTYEVLRDKEILTLADVLVDGPFLLEQKDAGLAFRGSRNQRIIDLREKES